MAQKIKEQKLSAMCYIKNNKRRVSVLIVSLCLCMTIIYVANILIMSAQATSFKATVEPYEKMENMYISPDTLGVYFEDYFDYEKFVGDYDEETIKDVPEYKEAFSKWKSDYADKVAEVQEKLRETDEIKDAFNCGFTYTMLNPPVGSVSLNIPIVERENVSKLLDHVGASLVDGRLPESPGEVVVDTATKLSNGYTLGCSLKAYGGEENTKYTIVGFVKCRHYFGCGVMKNAGSLETLILTNGIIKDLKPIIDKTGCGFNSENDSYSDYGTVKKAYEKYAVDEIEQATKYLYVGIFFLLFISLFMVYTTYLRDRHNEWCLYCSIGYSRKSIYFSIIRELLFTFVSAAAIGIVLTAGLVVTLDGIMLRSRGIACQYFYPKTLCEILCAFVFLMGLLQLPIRYALYKIRTIDAMEDDLY